MPRQDGSQAQKDLGHVDGPSDRRAHQQAVFERLSAPPAHLQPAEEVSAKPAPASRVCEVHKTQLRKVGWLGGRKIWKCTTPGCRYNEPD